MPVVTCPTCSFELNIRPEQVGKPICCTMCNGFFTDIELDKKSTRSSREEEEERPRRKSRFRDEDDDEDDDRYDDEDDDTETTPTNVFALLGLIFSILGFVIGTVGCLCCFIFPPLGGVISIASGVLSYVGMKRENGRGMATAGLAISIIGLITSIVTTVIYVIYGAVMFGGMMNNPGKNNFAPQNQQPFAPKRIR
jgi:Zn-finger nucleic acid-binding protein